MGKRNKIRYTSNEKPRVAITLTGKHYLLFVDDQEIDPPQKGDFLVYPYNEGLQTTRAGDYDSTGFSGYFKLDVFDGKDWKLVLLNDIFPNNENHFSKKERPIDTYNLCADILSQWTGKELTRTYREHYQPDDAQENQ